MPTSFKKSDAALLDFGVALASAARLFTAYQFARHPFLTDFKEPDKRVREFLAKHKDVFETLPSPTGEPARRRLTKAARRKYGIEQRAISGISQRSYHWIGVGDVWLTMTFKGGRPTFWRTEWDGQFDIYCVWKGRHYLMEYQRSPITKKKWQDKWARRIEWYKKQKFEVKPQTVLIDLTGQEKETIQLPAGTIHVTNMEFLAHQLSRPPQ